MQQSKFTTGSIMKHVVIMSTTSSIGLMAIFMVDLVDMYFLSIFGNVELTSAVGYAGTILFFTTSVCIGLSIGTGALVSRSIGAKDFEKAKRYLINIYFASTLFTCLIAIIIWPNISYFLSLLGAEGNTASFAGQYLKILIPSIPLMGLSMISMAALRAVGDAKRAMYSTLISAAVNGVLDPLFIFTFDLGIEGAALASVCARFSMLLVSMYPIYKHHNLFIKFNSKKLMPYLKDFLNIAFPSILTNTATPIGAGYVIKVMATFGDSAVAGMAIVSKLTPVAFGVVFALSGAVGPIIGQNLGAKNYLRVRRVVLDAFLFLATYVVAVSIILFFLPNWLTRIFSMDQEAGIFSGATFVANATFNNLGKATYSTLTNFCKATIGTIPFVYFGAQWFGASGVILGQALGAVCIGLVSIIWVLRTVKKLS
jgi:putative MATE family efflux protein